MNRENIETLEKFDRLTFILTDWAVWNAQYSGIRQSSGSVGLTSGYSASKSFDELLSAVESTMCRLVDAAVDDLDAGQRAAINRCYGLCAVFRFPRGNYADLLLSAHERLMITLSKKGVVI